MEISIDLAPISLIVSNLLTPGAHWQHSAQRLYLTESLLEHGGHSVLLCLSTFPGVDLFEKFISPSQDEHCRREDQEDCNDDELVELKHFMGYDPLTDSVEKIVPQRNEVYDHGQTGDSDAILYCP